MRPLVASARGILKPLRDVLGGLEGAAPAIGLAGSLEDVLHRLARRALRHPLRQASAVGSPGTAEKLGIVADTVLQLAHELGSKLGPDDQVGPQPDQQHDDEIARNQLQAHVATLLKTTPNGGFPLSIGGLHQRSPIITAPFGASSSRLPKPRTAPMFRIDPLRRTRQFDSMSSF